jgi:hypothetical protein
MTKDMPKPYDSWPDPDAWKGYPRTEREARKQGKNYWCPLGGCAGSMGCCCTC